MTGMEKYWPKMSSTIRATGGGFTRNLSGTCDRLSFRPAHGIAGLEMTYNESLLSLDRPLAQLEQLIHQPSRAAIFS